MSEPGDRAERVIRDASGNTLNPNGILAAVEEAKNTPIQFAPRERAAYAKARVMEVRRLRALGQNDIQIKAALGDFVEKYPNLFEMAAQQNFDERQFDMMLGLMEKMNTGMSAHQASVIVGQSLVDKFIKPMIGEKEKEKMN